LPTLSCGSLYHHKACSAQQLLSKNHMSKSDFTLNIMANQSGAMELTE